MKNNKDKCPTCGAIKMARLKLDISDEAILLGCKEGFFELALSKKGSKWVKQYLKEKEREQAKR